MPAYSPTETSLDWMENMATENWRRGLGSFDVRAVKKLTSHISLCRTSFGSGQVKTALNLWKAGPQAQDGLKLLEAEICSGYISI
ncbi:uncharacterized protein EAF01_008472 [Botrytis porri]|uniref:Uncharacterized protein n=1 Tax=Botrytis porri TaxID=87229 RepID=A0A4Z1KJD9_9HELO|nr:uncharacterized protein EAF01_008472 [Botrytis porri]KAF7899259.1 hypothetical protein EAF01_008472 [Botrytis porri]TGO86203.1 hypothetical protein BPOR_0324g00030 [Botrytis porri]